MNRSELRKQLAECASEDFNYYIVPLIASLHNLTMRYVVQRGREDAEFVASHLLHGITYFGLFVANTLADGTAENELSSSLDEAVTTAVYATDYSALAKAELNKFVSCAKFSAKIFVNELDMLASFVLWEVKQEFYQPITLVANDLFDVL